MASHHSNALNPRKQSAVGSHHGREPTTSMALSGSGSYNDFRDFSMHIDSVGSSSHLPPSSVDYMSQSSTLTAAPAAWRSLPPGVVAQRNAAVSQDPQAPSIQSGSSRAFSQSSSALAFHVTRQYQQLQREKRARIDSNPVSRVPSWTSSSGACQSTGGLGPLVARNYG